MKMEVNSMIKKKLTQLFAFTVSMTMLLGLVYIPGFAEISNNTVTGKVYEFKEDSEYEISETENFSVSNKSNTYGDFVLNGDVTEVTDKNGMPFYEVSEGNLSFSYIYDYSMLKADKDSWHLYEDDTEEIDGADIDKEVQKGLIWLQTSMDNTNWNDAFCLTNAFDKNPMGTEDFYTTRDIELINGCYYRLIVAYGTSMRTEKDNFLFVNTDEYDYKKYAEVYEFYAFTDTGEKEEIDYSQTYNIGTRVRVDEFDGYYGEEDIEKDDEHYGWELGNFFISGYTDNRVSDDGKVVFLKNLDDKVTLWFNLAQNIDALNGDKDLKITSDTEGYDRYFETPRTDFGKGTLIVRYTDYNNNKSEPQIYTNYLEANTSFGADTKVKLFEEGDYEVALDYEVTYDGLINTVGHYRIFFEFSVRNGNCMVYPFDVITGSELSNSSMTENGFRLDLAKSRYLNVNIKRELMKETADGLVEDTRFNGPARDGAEYTDEGIYTITVENEYTGQNTVKKIYVGTDSILRAYMTTGLSIPEINELVNKGATINNDGTIQLAQKIIEPETTEAVQATSEISEEKTEAELSETTVTDTQKNDKSKLPIYVIIIVTGVVVLIIIISVIMIKKKTHKSEEGGM